MGLLFFSARSGVSRPRKPRPIRWPWQHALDIYFSIDGGKQAGCGIMTDGDGIALVPCALKQVRRRNSVSHVRRHADQARSITIASQVHHLEFGRGKS